MKVGKEKYVFNKSNKCRVDVNMYNEVLSKKKKKTTYRTKLNESNLYLLKEKKKMNSFTGCPAVQ